MMEPIFKNITWGNQKLLNNYYRRPFQLYSELNFLRLIECLVLETQKLKFNI